MEIRPTTPVDLERLADIDGTIDSSHYVHVQRSGEGLALAWTLEERPLRTRLIESNPLNDEIRFMLRQVTLGAEDGVALVAEHDSVVVASILAHVYPATAVLRVLDLRVDFEQRRQGLAMAMLYRLIQEAGRRELRAVMAQSKTNNMPIARLLLKTGFDLAGLDMRHQSNHDLVKESVSLFWYAGLD